MDNNLNSLFGKIVDGKNDATQWLIKFNDAYSIKLGMKIYPGSLNLFLSKDFFLLKSPRLIRMLKEEYGGQRDIGIGYTELTALQSLEPLFASSFLCEMRKFRQMIEPQSARPFYSNVIKCLLISFIG